MALLGAAPMLTLGGISPQLSPLQAFQSPSLQNSYMCSSIHRGSGVHTPFLWKQRDIKHADDLCPQETYVACKRVGFTYSSLFVFSYLVAPSRRTANPSSMDRIFGHWGVFCSLALFLCLSTPTAAQAVSPSVPPAVVKQEAAQILLQDPEKPCNRAVSL